MGLSGCNLHLWLFIRQTVIPRAMGTHIHDTAGMDRLLPVSIWPVGLIWNVFYIRPQTFPA
jgi:hypothetical protein